MLLDFFSVIHEFAVLGTTFFLMALATLWYSPLAFGVPWSRALGTTGAVFDESSPAFVKQLLITFFAYAAEVALIAWLLAYAPLVDMGPIHVAGLVCAFVLVVTATPAVFENKSLQYYAIHTGFMVLFVVVGVASLTYWPW